MVFLSVGAIVALFKTSSYTISRSRRISTKGFDFICNVDDSMVNLDVTNTETDKKGTFGKYFDFFKVSESNISREDNTMNKNLQKLRDAFNNKK